MPSVITLNLRGGKCNLPLLLLLFVRLFPVGYLHELSLHHTFCTFSTSPQMTRYLIFGFSIGRGYMNSIMDTWLWKKRNPCFIAYLLWKLNMKYNFLFLFSQEISKSRMKRIGIFKKMKKKKKKEEKDSCNLFMFLNGSIQNFIINLKKANK